MPSLRSPLGVTSLLVLLVASAGCSLVTIQSEVEPMPRGDLEARLLTRELITVFADRVELAAARISAESTDPGVRAAALRWRLGAIEACRAAGLRQDPREALVDVWGLSLQQRELLTTGGGAGLFGSGQPLAVDAAESLVADVERIADATMGRELRATMAEVASEYARRHPISGLDFQREPILPLWLEAAGPQGRVATVGTGPEVLQDVSDRLRVMGEGVPKTLAWRTELALTERQEDIEQLHALLTQLDHGLKGLSRLAETSPELAAAAARELQRELGPPLERLDGRWKESLSTLALQREAVTRDLERMQADLTAALRTEREALTAALDHQRAAVMAEADGIATNVTDRALSHLRSVLREVLLLVIVLVALVLGLPFAAGYLVGRTRARPAAR